MSRSSDPWNTVYVDLDGTISNSRWPFTDDQMRSFSPIAKAREGLGRLMKAGRHIVIWTARPKEAEAVTREWLEANRIPFDELRMEKPKWLFILDDRAWRFDGNWDDEVVDELVDFKTWWELEAQEGR